MHIFALLSCTLVCLEPTALFWDNIRGHTVGGALLSHYCCEESHKTFQSLFSPLHIHTFISRFGFCMGATAVCARQVMSRSIAKFEQVFFYFI